MGVFYQSINLEKSRFLEAKHQRDQWLFKLNKKQKWKITVHEVEYEFRKNRQDMKAIKTNRIYQETKLRKRSRAGRMKELNLSSTFSPIS